jgi:hypothetical protein
LTNCLEVMCMFEVVIVMEVMKCCVDEMKKRWESSTYLYTSMLPPFPCVQVFHASFYVMVDSFSCRAQPISTFLSDVTGQRLHSLRQGTLYTYRILA